MEKKTLAEIVATFQSIEQELIESGGELSPTIEKLHLDLTDRLEDKVEGYSIVLDRAKHTAAFYEAEAAKYANIAKGLKRGADFLKDNLKAAMIALDQEEILAGSVRAKLVGCARSLVISEPELVPESFRIVESRPDSGRIKATLEAGNEIPGCSLSGGKALRFYPNRGAK